MTGCLFSVSQPLLSSCLPAPCVHSLCLPCTKQQKRTHTRTEHGEKNLPPSCSASYQSAALGEVLADLHWLLWVFLYPWCSVARKKTKKRSLLIHQTSTCQTLAQENCHKFFFLFFFLLFSSWQITVMSQTVRREQWSAFCLPFSIANWILCNPSEHACTVEVSHHRWTSTTDTIATTGKKNKTQIQHARVSLTPATGLEIAA